MTAEEKAKELIEIFWHLDEECEIEDGFEFGRKCALICVDEIEKASHKLMSKDLSDLQYWQEVKQEIELLKK